MIKVGISGASGRMGKVLQSVIKSYNNCTLVSTLTSSSTQDDIKNACSTCDVIIDYSSPNSIKHLIQFSILESTNIIIGTTNLNSKHLNYIKDAAKEIAIVYAPNTSLGANLLNIISIKIAKILRDYDTDIIEAHHRYKIDAPSGTALEIGQSIANAREIKFDTHVVFDRYNRSARKKDDITISSIRAGGIYGEHEVLFTGDDEVISVNHRVLSRNTFAKGALYAALWIINKKPGLYSMQDVLFLDK